MARRNPDAASRPADDLEPPSISRSEHLLSWVLSGFILLALSWGYVNIDDAVRDSRAPGRSALQQPLDQAEVTRTQRQRDLDLMGRLSENAEFDAEQRSYERSDARNTARERYRTALDAGDPSAALKAAYQRADERAVAASTAVRTLRRERRAALADLKAFDRERAATVRPLQTRADAYSGATDRWIFLWRSLLAFGTLGLSLLALRRITERAPRASPLVQAAVGAAALLSLGEIVDYSEVSFDFASVGPLGLAFLGAALTIAAFLALQRYLRTQRPARRVRAHECAACGYPAGTATFCEGCGRAVVEPCGACEAPRRAGTHHCGACGAQ